MDFKKTNSSPYSSVIYKRIIFFSIIVLASVYSSIVYTGGTDMESGRLSSVSAIEGKLVWQKYNCTACHQLYGLGGYLGPDLTNETRLKGKEYARWIISHGLGRMPDLKIPANEVIALADYLECLNKSGEYPIKNTNANFWGDIEVSQAGQP